MAEVLRDLVVTLSLQSENFSRNLMMINNQIREAESEFRLAGAGVENYGNTTEGMKSKLEMLHTTLGHQQNAVGQYERMLARANTRLTESYNRQQDYTGRLDAARIRQEALRQEVERSTQTYEEYRKKLGENDAETIKAKQSMEAAEQEYATATEDVDRLTGQVDSLSRTTQNAANSVTTAQTRLNNARVAVRETEAAIDKTNAQLRTAQSLWTAWGNTLTAASTKLQSIGKSATMTGMKMTTMVTLPITKLGKGILQSSMDFESSFTSVRKTVEATEAEYARLAAASKEMSTQIAASTTEINEVMATGGQLGIATDKLTDFTRVMIDLGNSCEDLDAATAAEQLAKFANIMGTDQSLFRNIGSTVVDLGNNFATTEAPIVEMAMRLAGAGKQVGLTEAQVLGLSAALSSVGIQAQMGGSAMSKALIKMEVAAKTGNSELEDFARVSGMTADEFVDAWEKDPVDVFQRFITGIAEMSDEGISAVQTLDEIGIKEIRLRDTLLRSVNAHELFADAQARANRAWEENIALEVEANKRYATLESRLTNLKNKATLFAQTLGDDMRPAVEKVMAGIDSFIDKLRGLDQGQRLQILKFAGLAAAAGPVLLIFGRITTVVGKAIGALGGFCTAVGQAGGGMSGLVTVLMRSPAAWFAVGAAVIYGTKRLFDWVSGADIARAAQERLNETVRQWGENVTTAYEKSKGLAQFGLSAEDFSVPKMDIDWLEQLKAVWSDGKSETDEIVNETVKGFTDGTDAIREKLLALKEAAGGGVFGDLDESLEQLEAMDREVEEILRKRQNGNLTDQDVVRLQELLESREAIEIRYHLVPDSAGAFDSIVQSAEAALSRGGDSAVVFSDAYAAATQGLGAYIDSLNAEYDARYRIISAMEDSEAKEQQLGELRVWYNEQANTAQQQYYETLQQTAEQTGVFADSGEFGQAAQQLSEISSLMEAAAGKDGISTEMNALRDALTGLDEGTIVEMETAIASMEAAAVSAGTEVPAEVQKAKEALEEVKAAATDTSNVFSEDVQTSINDMFSGLGDEAHEVFAALNCDELSTAYDAWAAGEHAPIVGQLDTESITEIDVTGNITNVLAQEGATFEVDANGNITGVTWPEGSEYETDIKGHIIGVTTPEGTEYTLDTKGNITSVSAPQGVTYSLDTQGNVTGITTPEGVTFDIDARGNITSVTTGGDDPLTLDCTGSMTEVEFPEGTEYDVDVDGNVTAIKTPDGITYTVDATGNITAITTQSGLTYTADGSGRITAVALDPNVVLPTLDLQATATVAGVNFNEGQFTNSGVPSLEYKAAEGRENRNAIGAVDYAAPDTIERLHKLAEGVRELGAAQAELQGMESAGIPDVMAYEEMRQRIEALSQSVQGLGEQFGSSMIQNGGMGFQNMAQYVANGMQLMNDGALNGSQIEEYTQVVSDLATVMNDQAGEAAASAGTAGTTLSDGMADAMNSYDWSTTGATVMSDIVAGFETAGGDLSQLGEDIAAGVGEGEAGHDFSAEAEATVANDESALRGAAASQSPAQRFVPLGDDISAGIGQGMGQHDFSGDAEGVIAAIEGAITPDSLGEVGTQAGEGLANGLSATDFSGAGATVGSNVQSAVNGSVTASTLTPAGQNASRGLANGMTSYSFGSVGTQVASKVKSSVSSSLGSSTLYSVGTSVMAGLASGISSGTSSVVSAMRAAAQAAVQAAKSELQINSPSRVFQDEVGGMVMKGFGAGVEEEAKHQARIIRNAASYLTREAQEGIAAGSIHTDNRQTFNQQSTVSLSGNSFYIRSEDDIHALAVEIAALTKRSQSGVGQGLSFSIS